MAETSILGFTPAGTPLRYAPAPTPAPDPKSSSSTVVDSFESMTTLTALVILYVTLVAPDPNLLAQSPMITSPVQLLPNNPIPESAVSPHLGGGMWIGPGVRFYVS